jgi:hypothetical protein
VVLEFFSISHIPREENEWANTLAQQASGHIVMSGLFSTKDRSALSNAYIHDNRSASGRIGEHVGMIDGRETDQEGPGEGSVEGGQEEIGGDRNIT